MFQLFLVLAFFAVAFAQDPPNAGKTALDEYVWRPDSNYGWEEIADASWHGHDKEKKRGYTAYTLNMTSQAWLTPADFSNTSDSSSIWWHILVVIVPDEIKYKNNGSLYITGGSMGSSLPDAKNEDIMVAAALAGGSGVITGALFQVPNEHVTFACDPKQQSRGEDAIIAFTWDHYLKDPSQPEWLLRFPMVKASLRAMDAMKEFTQKKYPDAGTSLDYYAVAGASKRGWTTWDVGAVDPKRVMLIIPIVLDAINFVKFAHHQYQSYNGWSWALHDYTEMNIMDNLDVPNMKLLQENVDPFYYRNRLTMPKLVVNAVLDEFQQPDDTHYWWADMPEPKHFIMTPNAEHSEATGIFEIVPAIASWVKSHLDSEQLPEFTWDINQTTGEIVATLNHVGIVKQARVWYAYSCGNNPDGKKRRDFRCINLDSPCACGFTNDGKCINTKSFWTPKKLEETKVNGKRTYSAKLDAPEDGRWIAYFIDIVYAKGPVDALLPDKELLPGFIPRDLAGRLQFTTEVSVFPNTFPYPGCGITNGVDTGIPCDLTLV